MNLIASLDLIELWPNGRRDRIRVEIGEPQFDERGLWKCPVLLTTIDGEVRHIHGEDSMQALCLAIRFLHKMLKSRLERGNRLLDPENDSEFPLQAYFGGNDRPDAGPSAEECNSL